MTIETLVQAPAAPIVRTTFALPPIGTLLAHLGGTFAAVQRAKPGSGLADYALIVPHGPEAEFVGPWGGEGQDEPGAVCMWDGLANTRALVESKVDHPAAQFCAQLVLAGHSDFFLPSLREIKALYANGCEAFSTEHWYLTSTQYSRYNAYGQDFDYGNTNDNDGSWSGARSRAVRRSSIESLIY